MLENGVLVNYEGEGFRIWSPPDRTSGSLPDNSLLWDWIWKSRDDLLGFAHSHPGHGVPGPSWTDITTFSAIELGLGRRLVWWITSEDKLVRTQWGGPEKYDYFTKPVTLQINAPLWLAALRHISYKENDHG